MSEEQKKKRKQDETLTRTFAEMDRVINEERLTRLMLQLEQIIIKLDDNASLEKTMLEDLKRRLDLA